MSSRFPDDARLACALLLIAFGIRSEARDLVVCADPDNLPYSHQDGSGFENRIVELIADDVGARVVYRWLPLRRGAVRKTVGAGLCDVLAGVPADPAGIVTTIPYYRSSYVFVTRKNWGDPVSSFDDARLRVARIGVPLIGVDGAAVPPAAALARRGIIDNVTGLPVYGVLPVAQRMIDALVQRRVDVAVLWGPQAGYFVRLADVPLSVATVPVDGVSPETFSIAIGVREGESALREELSATIALERSRITSILGAYGVPLLPHEK